jgi:hypothetical protein
MTFLTDKERKKGINEIVESDGTMLLGSDDLQYFKDKLGAMALRSASEEATLVVRKQIELLEDAIVIYHEHRPAEDE